MIIIGIISTPPVNIKLLEDGKKNHGSEVCTVTRVNHGTAIFVVVDIF